MKNNLPPSKFTQYIRNIISRGRWGSATLYLRRDRAGDEKVSNATLARGLLLP